MEARRKALVATLQDEAPEVRSAAARSLDRMDALQGLYAGLGTLSNLTAPQWVSLLRSLDGSRDETALKVGLKALEHSADDVRLAALDLVAQFRDWRTTSHLARLLADTLPPVRARAAEALGQLGDRRATAALAPLLSDPEPQVLARALEALGLLGYREGEETLLSLTRHQAPEVRAAAAEALGRIGVRGPA